MKKNSFFLSGIAALTLVFALFFAGCTEDNSEETVIGEEIRNDIYLTSIGNPVVTERVLSNGVVLTWPTIIEADEYKVLRSGGGQNTPIDLTLEFPTMLKRNYGIWSFSDLNTTAGNTLTPDTTYTYTVLAIPRSAVKDIGRWQKDIKIYTPLFGDDAVLSVASIDLSANTVPQGSDSPTGFYASISLTDIKASPGTLYSIERATVNANGNPGNFSDITAKLSTLPTNDSPIGTPTVDIFNNLSFALTTVYDRTLPFAEAKYLYRLKGIRTSDNLTEYLTAAVTTVVDFEEYLMSRLSLTIDEKDATTTDTAKYKITPGFTGKKGFFQTGDKVVLYWLIGKESDCYKTGPYKNENILEFSKGNFESAITPPIETQDLVVPPSNTTDNKYLYVQAWLERGNGKKIQLSKNSNWKGLGLKNATTPIQLNNFQYHVQLIY